MLVVFSIHFPFHKRPKSTDRIFHKITTHIFTYELHTCNLLQNISSATGRNGVCRKMASNTGKSTGTGVEKVERLKKHSRAP